MVDYVSSIIFSLHILHIYIYAYIYRHTFIHTYLNTYIHTYINTQTYIFSSAYFARAFEKVRAHYLWCRHSKKILLDSSTVEQIF